VKDGSALPRLAGTDFPHRPVGLMRHTRDRQSPDWLQARRHFGECCSRENL